MEFVNPWLLLKFRWIFCQRLSTFVNHLCYTKVIDTQCNKTCLACQCGNACLL
ncbi:hypothetical protein EVA_21572 [gut metagenome]|uniref:Uncharacterized protein n=1 Tax=gut metagenome TaxID=749906 RepID=J9F604_9ZZZZ